MIIKDYIYLDENLLNSMFAQFNRGIISSISSTLGNTANKTDSSESTKSRGGGLNGFFGFDVQAISGNSQTSMESLSETQKEVINNILHDYSVDLLIEKIKENNLLKTKIEETSEGDFVLFKSYFNLYDFKHLLNIANDKMWTLQVEETIENTKKQIKELEAKQNKNKQENTFLIALKSKLKDYEKKLKEESHINNLIPVLTFGDKIFYDSDIIATANSLNICERKNFRINQSQLSVINDAERKITVFGIITTEKKKSTQMGTSKIYKVMNCFNCLQWQLMFSYQTLTY